MPGSDVDASLYLMLMLENGEDPKFIARRMIILYQKISACRKHNSRWHISSFISPVPNALAKAKQATYDLPNNPIPLHLRNASTKLMKDLDYSKNYE